MSGVQSAILSSEKSQIISQLSQKQDLSSISYSVDSIIANAQTSFQTLIPDNQPDAALVGTSANFKLTNSGNLASINLHVTGTIATANLATGSRFTDLIEMVTFKTSSTTIQTFTGHALQCLLALDKNNVALAYNNSFRDPASGAEHVTSGQTFVSDVQIPISFCTRVQSHLYLRPQETVYLVVKFRTQSDANIGTTTFTGFAASLIVESFWLDSKSQEEYNKSFLSSPYTFVSFDTYTEVDPAVDTTTSTKHRINCSRPIFMACMSVTKTSGGGGRINSTLLTVSDTINDSSLRNNLPVCVQNLAARRMYNLEGTGVATDNNICFVNYNVNKDLDPKVYPTSALSVTQSNNPTYTLTYGTSATANYALEVTYLVYSIVNIDPQSSIISVSSSV